MCLWIYRIIGARDVCNCGEECGSLFYIYNVFNGPCVERLYDLFVCVKNIETI